MESGVFLPSLEQFMLSPLVTWVSDAERFDSLPKTPGCHLIDLEKRGVKCLYVVPILSNPSATPRSANKVNKDPGQRIQNLNYLVQQIKTYYLVSFGCSLLVAQPYVMLYNQSKQMKIFHLHFQCEKKEEYIESIQTLDFDTKAAIAAHIQELTHSHENVLDLQWLESSEMNPDEVEAIARNMAAHLRHVLEQRDTHLEVGMQFDLLCT
uniref:Uncharacterized protein n=1 Tax=Echeneis naucrates TaxID=173247 RepID=A0A665T893_ECHNA